MRLSLLMHLPDRIDGLDDALGHVVSGRGLGGEDEDARGDIEAGILQQAAVEREDVQKIEVLALVFVQTLDLHIEKRGGIDRDATVPLDHARKIDLVGLLDVHEIDLELRIVRVGFKGAKLVEIALPAVPDFRGDELAEAGIAGKEPAARSDAVGLVVKLARIESVEIREEIPFQELGMQRGHAIDRMASRRRKDAPCAPSARGLLR